MSNRYIGGVVTETTTVDQSPWSGSWTEQAAMQSFGSVLRITNSLRFRSSASAYLNRTPASAGSRTTFTLSFWIKRGKLGARQLVIIGDQSTNANYIQFSASDTLGFWGNDGTSSPWILDTTQVFRDPSAWYHIIWVFDSTQATSSNRVRMYVNGAQVTAFGTATYPTQNYQTYFNQAVAHQISGYSLGAGASYFDGYLAEVNFVDGQALPPTAFGAINKENGVWAPITYTGTYGLNGFRLTFNNTTSTTTLGYDSSGNGNNWTTNNISLTAGSTYDSMIDSPSKFPGASYGVGNYAVWNAIKLQGNSASNANLTATLTAGGPPYLAGYGVRSTMAAPSSGKWYCEITPVSFDTWSYVGVTDINGWATDVGNSGQYSVLYRANGDKNVNGTASSYGASYTTDTIGIALDIDSGTVTFYKNNTSQGAISLPSSTISYCFVVSNGNAQAVSFNANFGQRPFAYTPPTGYKTLCTQNLPNPTIFNGAQYMAATLYTGNGSTQSIVNANNGVSFQPDFVWIKDRSETYNHRLVDSVRGVGGPVLYSNLTNAEGTDTAGVTSLNSNGFAVGIDAGYNKSSNAYVGWQWKAGGTAVTNTAGSITSSVSANTTAGFSVVTYTGNGGTNGTASFGHGLGVQPDMVIIKSRNASSTNWVVEQTGIAYGRCLLLNDTAAVSGSFPDQFQFALRTSSVYYVGSTGGGSQNNANGNTYVAYCFAAIPGYSAFGSYVGNGSTDGTFVYCGFRPRWIMVKSSSNAGTNWVVIDTSRDPYNLAGQSLEPNLSNAEYTPASSGYPVDIVSNGFKWRDAGSASDNASGVTYIYAAFAENPFQNALAR